MKDQLTHERLRALIAYDPEIGVFTWLKNPRKRELPSGNLAGSLCKGRLQIGIDQKFYRAHRLAWLYMTGSWPDQEIDHIDGDKLNNRFANLRDVPRNLNAQNLRKALASSSIGLLGVTKINHRFRAKLVLNKKTHHIGYFDTPEEAHLAYVSAKRRLHPGCTL